MDTTKVLDGLTCTLEGSKVPRYGMLLYEYEDISRLMDLPIQILRRRIGVVPVSGS